MINTSEFSKRLKIIMDYYDESAASFAQNIGVQRSSISHILSGRNKPSLDFVMKVLHSYPEVDLYWLINGTGSFPKKEPHETNISQQQLLSKHSASEKIPQYHAEELKKLKNDSTKISEIDRIVFFFKDGSFKSYTN